MADSVLRIVTAVLAGAVIGGAMPEIAAANGPASGPIGGSANEIESLASEGDLQVADGRPQQSYGVIFVNPVAGHDQGGDGSQRHPLATITHALQVARPNTVIVLVPGEYSQASGETFPLHLKPGVTVQGTPGPRESYPVIRGSGIFASPSSGMERVTIVASDRSGLGNVAVVNPEGRGSGVWIEDGSPILRNNAFINSGYAGVYVAGSGAPLIEQNYFSENGTAGLVIGGPSQAQVQENLFENTGVGIQVAPEATPQILNNQIVRNQDGIILQANARPLLQDNLIAQNRRNGIVEFMPEVQNVVLSTAAPGPAVVQFGDALTQAPGSPSVPPDAAPPAPARAAATPIATAIAPAPEPMTAPPPPSEPAAPRGGPGAAAPAPAVTGAPEPAIAAPEEQAGAVEPGSGSGSGSGSGLGAGGGRADDPVEAPAIALAPPADLPLSVSLPAASPAPEAASPEGLEAAPATAGGPDLATIRDRLRARQRSAPAVAAAADGGSQPTAAVSIPLRVVPPSPDTVARPRPEAAPVAAVTAPSLPPLPATTGQPAATALPSLPPVDPDAIPLQVPGATIPVGQGGGLPTVLLSSSGLASPGSSPPAPPSRAAALGLHYKVLIPAADGVSQEQVRALVPDAFRVQVAGRTMMQAGAYPTEAEAREQAQTLQDQGLEAQVEYVP